MTKMRREAGMEQVALWNELKRVMRSKFMPQYFKRELFQKLQYLSQGNKSVEDYYKKMDVDEDEEATKARFIGGLDREIANLIELYHYEHIDDMLQMAQKVEKQLRKKSLGSSRFGDNTSTPTWRTNPNFGRGRGGVHPGVGNQKSGFHPGSGNQLSGSRPGIGS